MKKMLLVVVLTLAMFAIATPMVFAADGVAPWQITLSTATEEHNQGDLKWLTDFTNFNGTKRISRIELIIVSTNSAQTVTFGKYVAATSTMTPVTEWTYLTGADAANATATTTTKTYDFISPTSGSNLTYYMVTDAVCKKSAVNGAVTATYWYLK